MTQRIDLSHRTEKTHFEGGIDIASCVWLVMDEGRFPITTLNDFTFESDSGELIERLSEFESTELLAGSLQFETTDIRVQFRIRRRAGESIHFGFYDLAIRDREAIDRIRRQVADPSSDELHELSYDDLAKGRKSAVIARENQPAKASGNTKALAALVMLLGMLGIAVLLAAFVRSSSTISVSNSVLVGNYQAINTPAEGQLIDVRVSEGDVVETGQLLAVLQNAGADQEIGVVEAKRVRAERELSAYREQRNDFETTLTFHKRKLDQQLRVAEAGLLRIDAETKAAQSQLDRLLPLAENGNIGLSELDEARALLDGCKADRVEQETIIASVKMSREAAESSILVSDNSVANPLSELRAKIQVAQAAVDEHTSCVEHLRSLIGPTELRAPTDGTVYAVYRHEGEFLKLAEEAMAISNNETGWATGHVSAAKAVEVRPGQVVEVAFPSMGIETQGKVLAIGHRGVYGRGGYNAEFRGGPLEVPVKVSLDADLANVPAGMRLNMTIRKRDRLKELKKWMYDKLGVGEPSDVVADRERDDSGEVHTSMDAVSMNLNR